MSDNFRVPILVVTLTHVETRVASYVHFAFILLLVCIHSLNVGCILWILRTAQVRRASILIVTLIPGTLRGTRRILHFLDDQRLIIGCKRVLGSTIVVWRLQIWLVLILDSQVRVIWIVICVSVVRIIHLRAGLTICHRLRTSLEIWIQLSFDNTYMRMGHLLQISLLAYYFEDSPRT